MFTDEDAGTVQLQSTWRSELECHEIDVQTDVVGTEEKAEGPAPQRKDGETQTDKSCEMKEAEMEAVLGGFRDWDPPDAAMRDFIGKVGAAVLEELSNNDQSHAFDDFELTLEDEDDTVTCVHVLQGEPPPSAAAAKATQAAQAARAGGGRGERGERGQTGEGGEDSPLQCTGVSWNAPGSVLAASYGRFDISGWCNIPGKLCIWQMAKLGRGGGATVKKSKTGDPSHAATAPSLTIETSSCLMCVQCHPVNPSLVAGGTFNGEVRRKRRESMLSMYYSAGVLWKCVARNIIHTEK